MARSKLPNIDALSVGDLTQLIEKAQGLIAEKRKSAHVTFLARMRAEAEAEGLSFDDVMGKGPGGRRQRSDKGVKLKPKYEGPNGETYTGRGPTPKWLRDLEAKGHKRDRYLVK